MTIASCRSNTCLLIYKSGTKPYEKYGSAQKKMFDRKKKIVYAFDAALLRVAYAYDDKAYFID